MKFKIEKNIHTHGIEANIKDENNQYIYSISEGIYFNNKVLNFFDKRKNKIMYIEEENNTNLNSYNIYINEVLEGNFIYNMMFFKYNIEIKKKDDEYQVEGDYSSMEFQILKNGVKVAEVSKRSILLSEDYEIEILSKNDEKFLLGVIITIDYLLYDIGNANQL